MVSISGKFMERNTRQRQIILETIKGLKSHPTAAELYQEVRKILPHISISTVYRTLNLLADKGEVRRMETGQGENRYDGDLTPHHHVRCVVCGRVDDAKDLPYDLLKQKYHWINGYRILQQQVDFAGICPRCAQNTPPPTE